MPPATTARRVTGLQRQIYSLYKRSLQMAAAKPIETRLSWVQFISHQFRHSTMGGSLRKKDVTAIEYFLRRGEKMLESYKGDGVKSVSVPDGEGGWPIGWVGRGGKSGMEERRKSGEN